MATIRLYLDTRASKGEAPLKLCINHNSQTAFIPLGIRVLPDQWEKSSQRVVNHPNGKRINLSVSSSRNAAERALLVISDTRPISTMSATDLRDRIWEHIDPTRNSTTFLSRLERYTNLKTKKNTRQTFLWCATKLHGYDPEIGKRRFEDITTDYLKGLESFYSHLGVNTRSILFRNIRTVFNDAIDAGITTHYPFRSFRIKSAPTQKKALSPEQMRLLSQVDNEREYRDMFLLMFYLRGVNIGDLLMAKKDQIVNGRFEYRRNKVGTLFSVKIEPEAEDIIKRYKGKNYLLSPLDRYKDYKDYLHHLNAGLKRIGARRGKNNKIESEGFFPGLSSNWARHSWATIGISLDIPKETIAKGMGHGGGLTDIYIDFDMRKVDEANRKIIDAICG